MATAGLHASMLPAIKCSSCGVEVDLSMMMDHKCDEQAQESHIPEPQRLDHDRLPTPPPDLPAKDSPPHPAEDSLFTEPLPSDHSLEHIRLDDAKPSSIHIDSNIHNVVVGSESALTSPSSRSAVLATPLSPPRSATAPPPRTRSASPTLALSQDGAFPRFPTTRSRKDSKPKTAPSPLNLHAERIIGESALSPLSPRNQSGASVLQRMNTMAPGPFDAKHKKTDSKERLPDKAFGLFRRKSSKKNLKSHTGSSLSVENPPPLPPSPMLSEAPLHLPSTDAESGAKIDRDGHLLPVGPAPPRPTRPQADSIEGLQELLHASNSGHAVAVSIASTEPGTPGTMNSDLPTPDLSEQPNDYFRGVSRITSDNSVYTTASGSDRSTQFGLRGLPQISEDDAVAETESDSGAPPAWPSGRLRSLSRSGEQPKARSTQMPPLPNLLTSQDHTQLDRRHTPTESLSSSDSRSIFDSDRTESSRSSPPTSTTSGFSPQKETADEPNDFGSSLGELLPSTTYSRAANFSRPKPAEISVSSPSPTATFSELVKPNSPTKAGSPRERFPPRNQSISSASINSSLQTQPTAPIPARTASRKLAGPGPAPASKAPPSPMYPPPPPIPDDTRLNVPRRTGAPKTKGPCRGCGLDIRGKSVKAADGRLTGRYHRECFMCKTCKEPFQTADFYVLDNDPYCAHHYHLLNNSLCSLCNEGIEGKYLETGLDKKYHLNCFTCHDCHKPLSRDYFEINGIVYCEKDAPRAHQKSNLLSPGKRFPERRTTRLMMM